MIVSIVGVVHGSFVLVVTIATDRWVKLSGIYQMCRLCGPRSPYPFLRQNLNRLTRLPLSAQFNSPVEFNSSVEPPGPRTKDSQGPKTLRLVSYLKYITPAPVVKFIRTNSGIKMTWELFASVHHHFVVSPLRVLLLDEQCQPQGSRPVRFVSSYHCLVDH